MFQAKVVEKIEIYLIFNSLFFFENCAVYEIMLKNVACVCM
jgi:hypothetical protein